MMSISTRLAALVVAGSLLMGVGCSSADRHVFNSTANRPVTVSVVDTTNEEPLWTMPVPAGQKLILDLDHSSTADNPFMAAGVPADRLRWRTYPLDSKAIVKGHQVGQAIDSGTTSLPGTPVVLKVTYLEPTPTTASKPVVIEEPTEAAPVETEEPAAVEEAPADTATDVPPADETMTQEAPAEAEAAAPADAETGAQADQTPADAEADAEEPVEEPIMFK